ncbi:MAG: hypothetical protein AABZ12_02070 [Planctomycetota bacterium]
MIRGRRGRGVRYRLAAELLSLLRDVRSVLVDGRTVLFLKLRRAKVMSVGVGGIEHRPGTCIGVSANLFTNDGGRRIQQ